jgi:hypothetical protein
MILNKTTRIIGESFHSFYEKRANSTILNTAKESINNFLKSVEEIEQEFMNIMLPETFPENIHPSFYEENY